MGGGRWFNKGLWMTCVPLWMCLLPQIELVDCLSMVHFEGELSSMVGLIWLTIHIFLFLDDGLYSQPFIHIVFTSFKLTNHWIQLEQNTLKLIIHTASHRSQCFHDKSHIFLYALWNYYIINHWTLKLLKYYIINHWIRPWNIRRHHWVRHQAAFSDVLHATSAWNKWFIEDISNKHMEVS